jgi:hypothetical protein
MSEMPLRDECGKETTLGEVLAKLTDETTHPDRPFTGQPHTQSGTRGKTIVQGIRFRDLADCVCRALVNCVPDLPAEMRQRAEDRTLNYNDLYYLDFSDVDPLAIVQAVSCEVEKAMGIYPNVSPIERIENDG